MSWLDTLKFDADGLIPAIAQDRATGQVMMVAWQNKQALELTFQTKQAVYFSRSRGKLWHKGETSGHTQIVHDIYTDCDQDVIILSITQIGDIACHTGRASCFYQKLDDNGDWQTISDVLKDPKDIYGKNAKPLDGEDAQYSQATKPSSADVLGALDAILADRKSADKDSSYVSSLYHKGLNKILEKVGEETTEAIISAKELQLVRATGDNDEHAKADVVYEVADMWFHSLVALHELGLSGDDVLTELGRRFGLSGIDEKNARTPKG